MEDFIYNLSQVAQIYFYNTIIKNYITVIFIIFYAKKEKKNLKIIDTLYDIKHNNGWDIMDRHFADYVPTEEMTISKRTLPQFMRINFNDWSVLLKTTRAIAYIKQIIKMERNINTILFLNC